MKFERSMSKMSQKGQFPIDRQPVSQAVPRKGALRAKERAPGP